MSLYLRKKPKPLINTSTISIYFLQSQLKSSHYNAQFAVNAAVHEERVQGRGILRQQVWRRRRLLNGSSLSFYGLFHSSNDCSLHSSHCEIPVVLSHPTSFNHVQETMSLMGSEKVRIFSTIVSVFPNLLRSPTAPYLELRRVFKSRDVPRWGAHQGCPNLGRNVGGFRGFCSVSEDQLEGVVDSDADSELKSSNNDEIPIILSLMNSGKVRIFSTIVPVFLNLGRSVGGFRGFCSVTEDEVEGVVDSDVESELEGSDGCESGESKADPEEVDKVCKVIDELFALDRNMEAVLDECGISLSHDLVVDVLERYKHARKPAFRFFCWASQKSGYTHDSRTYNRMMTILGKSRQFETMVSVLEEMGEKGLLSIETFIISIRAFADAKERKKAIGMFELMKKYKFKVGAQTINCLLDALGKAKLGKEAQVLFEKLEHRFTPNLQTYTVLLNGWCRVKNLMEAGKVWNLMIDVGFKPDIVAHNTMLEGLLRGQRLSNAIKLFEVMKAKGPAPNVRSYTILIRYLCKQKKMNEAVDYFKEMVDSGCVPDAAVYTCLITGYGNEKKMDNVYELLKEMKEKGCPPDARTYSALIKLMANRRMPDDVVRLYKKMIQNGIQPSIHIYNMMMKSFFMARDYDMGRAVWDEMIKKGCCPDKNSYIVLIGGLIRQGRSVEACQFLEEMIEKGMNAPQLDYNKFAADFSRAGKPDVLEELARRMKFSGKFEVSNFFARWSEMMKKRVKRRDNFVRNVPST